MDIHSRHIRLTISLNHTQKLPSIAFIKSDVIRNQVKRCYALAPHVFHDHVEQFPHYASVAIVFYRARWRNRPP